jgi:Ca2+-binding RTX toxin-like protein
VATVRNDNAASQSEVLWFPSALAQTVRGTRGDDRLSGGDGDDVINGGKGNDRIDGDDGHDTLNGGAGDDRIEGDDGHDRIDGGNGNDRLEGDDGRDTILGGAGNDWIEGGDDDDTLTGGKGSDTFVFGDDDDFDTITDFQRNDFIRIETDDDDLPLTFADLDMRNTRQGVVITFDRDGNDTDAVLLEGVRANQLNAGQFIFVMDDQLPLQSAPADLVAGLV